MSEPIELMPDDQVDDAPPLPGRVMVGADSHAACDALGRELIRCSHECVQQWGDFHLALSGGSTPFPFYQSLMTDPLYRSLPWRMTHIWIVDERRVGFGDPLSNWGKIAEILSGHSGIPDGQLHPMEATLPDAPARYELELHRELERRPPGERRLDMVILGMGDNGHTASLFPHTAILDERTRWVGECSGPTVTPPARVTMTYPLINGARLKAVLVVGAAKAPMIARVARRSDDFHELPILGVTAGSATAPDGELVWCLDRAACG